MIAFRECQIKAILLCFRSNCDPVVRNELRKYYNRPYFIPLDAETGDQDWIFMGGPGPGAPIHVSDT